MKIKKMIKKKTVKLLIIKQILLVSIIGSAKRREYVY